MISGMLGVVVGDEVRTLHPGDTATLPARVKHQWWNPSKQDVVFRVEVSPAGGLEVVLEALAGMAQAGKLNRRAMPKNPFDLINVGKQSECYLPILPIWLQKPMLAMGSQVGRLLGASPEFARYRTPTPAPAAAAQAEPVSSQAA